MPSDDQSNPSGRPADLAPAALATARTGSPTGSVLSPRLRRSARVAGTLISAVVLGGTALVVPSATAAPTPTISEVEKKVDQLQDQAEQASEQYNETEEKLKSINVRLKAAQVKLERQRAEVKAAKQQVGRLAAETYRRGELSTLDVVLGDDPDSVLAQAGYLPSLGERQSGAMNRLKQGEAQLVETRAEIKDQQQKAEMAEIRMRLNKNTVNQKLAMAKAQLNSLKATQRRALAAQQARQDLSGLPKTVVGGGGTAYCAGKAVDAPNGAAKAAIKFACDHLGDPYVWAAAGPNSWDCSGLVMKAYAAGGISLPHSSAMQAGYGTRVSVSDLQPGDLVFFHSPISHVAIYLGDGLIVHAPHTGDVVRIASLWTTPSAAVRF